MCSFRLFGVQKPKEEEVQKSKGKEVQNPNEEDVWSTEVTDDDWRNAVEDAFGVKYSKDWKILLGAPTRLKGEYSIIEGVNVIADNAFSECEHLTYIDIPDSVTCIGDRAFHICTSLTSINIPNNVTTVEEGVFNGCKSLTCIYIPDSVTTIDSGAFGNCNNIPSKIKSDIIKRFGKEVFESWPLLIPSAESAKTH